MYKTHNKGWFEFEWLNEQNKNTIDNKIGENNINKDLRIEL